MTASEIETGPRWSRAIECVAFFLAAPLALALALPPTALFPALFGMTALGLVLLARTPGFEWRDLATGWGRIDWRRVAVAAALTAFATGFLVWLLVPGQALILPRTMPTLWLTILALYPLLSALPQEIIFRPLFFRRYGHLFPGETVAILVNAAAFALAHLMFWNWIALTLTFAGGLIFAVGYLRAGFATAVALHAVCGLVLFTSGLGVFFYHGAVDLP